MLKLIFATHNAHKLKEAQEMFEGICIVEGLSDIGITEEIEETGSRLEDNALQKAEYVVAKTGLCCFADDTGLEVYSLDNEPGVYSARYAGVECNSEKNIDKLLSNLEGKSNREAQFRTVIALVINGKRHLFEGVAKGRIAIKRFGAGGFGYDSVFLPDGETKTFAQLSAEQKNKISHRGIAVEKLKQFLATV